MSSYEITGGNLLNGTVKISGAKNAALKLMAASLLTSKEVVLQNVPLIEDVFIMTQALSSLGARVEFDGNTFKIQANELTNCTAPYNLVNKMRASILVMGPLLARLGRSKAAMPGGCKIGLRKIDFHIKGLEALGAQINLKNGYIDAKASRLQGTTFHLDFPSVGATENILMAAALAEGTTIIKNAAREPELVDLVEFLNVLGAQINGAGTSTLAIKGVNKLNGGTYRVMADRIEAGTFLLAGALCGKKLQITDFKPNHLSAVLEKLKEIGVNFDLSEHSINIKKASDIKGCSIVTLPYPGFPTDLQGPFMPLLSLAKGSSVITENVFEGRFLLAEQLEKMGVNIKIQDHRALIKHVEYLTGCEVEAPDLRGGAALVLAGLAAKGTTVVKNINHIDRGYEKLEEKLVSIGAVINRTEIPVVRPSLVQTAIRLEPQADHLS